MNIVKMLLKVLLILFFVVIPLSAQQKVEVYEFPIKPGTPEWKTLKSHEEMLKVLQIPEDILKNIPTEQLVQTCLNYPLYSDMMAFNNLQDGVESIINGFNGLQELMKREKGGSELLKIYLTKDPGAIKKEWNSIKKVEYAAKLVYLQMLLSQDLLLSKLNKSELTSLLIEAIKKFNLQAEYPEIYGSLNFNTIASMTGRILLREKDNIITEEKLKNGKLQILIEKAPASFSDPKLLTDIISFAVNYLNK